MVLYLTPNVKSYNFDLLLSVESTVHIISKPCGIVHDFPCVYTRTHCHKAHSILGSDLTKGHNKLTIDSVTHRPVSGIMLVYTLTHALQLYRLFGYMKIGRWDTLDSARNYTGHLPMGHRAIGQFVTGLCQLTLELYIHTKQTRR